MQTDFNNKIIIEHAMITYIGVARGCSGCTCTPQGGEKNFFRPNLQEKMCKCTPAGHEVHPPSQSKSQFLVLLGGLDLEVYLDGDD